MDERSWWNRLCDWLAKVSMTHTELVIQESKEIERKHKEEEMKMLEQVLKEKLPVKIVVRWHWRTKEQDWALKFEDMIFLTSKDFNQLVKFCQVHFLNYEFEHVFGKTEGELYG